MVFTRPVRWLIMHLAVPIVRRLVDLMTPLLTEVFSRVGVHLAVLAGVIAGVLATFALARVAGPKLTGFAQRLMRTRQLASHVATHVAERPPEQRIQESWRALELQLKHHTPRLTLAQRRQLRERHAAHLRRTFPEGGKR